MRAILQAVKDDKIYDRVASSPNVDQIWKSTNELIYKKSRMNIALWGGISVETIYAFLETIIIKWCLKKWSVFYLLSNGKLQLRLLTYALIMNSSKRVVHFVNRHASAIQMRHVHSDVGHRNVNVDLGLYVTTVFAYGAISVHQVSANLFKYEQCRAHLAMQG